MDTLIRRTFNWVMAIVLAFALLPVSPGNAAALSDHPDGNEHTLVPGAGTGKEQVIHDQVNVSKADQKTAVGGEQYSAGRYERPFNKDMVYLPYLDIVKSTLQREDANFIYVTIQVQGSLTQPKDKPALYGIELDTNLDGRSEYLLFAKTPTSTEWSVNGVNIWKSSSADLPGADNKGSIPITGSSGYDTDVFIAGNGSDSDLAWVRLSPDKPETVELAFKNSLIGGKNGRFVWRPMTDGAGFSAELYDLNVSFTLEQAGSPLRDSLFYPLKEVYAVDSTCRVASGYTASGNEPGLCPLPPPPDKPDRPGGSPGRQQPPPTIG